MAVSRSALGVMMMALFPPSSKSDFPNRAPTRWATSLPIRVDPVADNREMRWSSAIHWPTSAPPLSTQETPSGILFSFNTSAIMF